MSKRELKSRGGWASRLLVTVAFCALGGLLGHHLGEWLGHQFVEQDGLILMRGMGIAIYAVASTCIGTLVGGALGFSLRR